MDLLTRDKVWQGIGWRDMAGAYPEVYVQVTSLGNLVRYSHLVIDVQILEKAFFFSSSNFNEMCRDKGRQTG